jgi:hypothetical protein
LELALSNGICISTEARVENWSAKIIITNIDKLPSNISNDHQTLTSCEADIVNLLRGFSGPISGSEIIKKLEENSMFHGDSTIRHALAKMTKSKVLTTAVNGRGYILS